MWKPTVGTLYGPVSTEADVSSCFVAFYQVSIKVAEAQKEFLLALAGWTEKETILFWFLSRKYLWTRLITYYKVTHLFVGLSIMEKNA